MACNQFGSHNSASAWLKAGLYEELKIDPLHDQFNVTVAVSAHQQGVGSSMMKFSIENAKEDGGITLVYLHVRRDNIPALALYKKMGFEILAVATPHLPIVEQSDYLLRNPWLLQSFYLSSSLTLNTV
ncbi:hypothetical protein C5167_035536 [Papaver somniferum]|uniref:N-acetyltransferase domain-containing protein n=1 Tax=Papaver somniferum TaxID=3469 RepID=A0A4Y7KJ31_PAPSO|nr:hypothetical protein C5167_035536 [Papaver somniferum]